MLLLAVLFACAMGLIAQTSNEPSKEASLLSKVRTKMQWNLHRQPNYTCTETVERAQRTSAAHKFELLDTLRLDVALIAGKEMFGWPGAKSFEETDVRKIVSNGAFGNGNFANHARAIFEGHSAHFTERGETTIEDRPAMRFDYEIPLAASSYILRARNRQATVAYHGSIYADPKTFDVERIEVETGQIPSALGLTRATDRMDYASVSMSGGSFLLPESSELIMSDRSGKENRNLVHFASCREFRGQSVLSFAGADNVHADNIKAVATVPQVDLPRDLSLLLSLTDDLNTNGAAVGDPVSARLESDVKQKGRVLFLKGAIAHGRITRLDHHDGFTILGLEFSELESGGVRAPLNLRLDDVAGSEFLNSPPNLVVAPAPRPGEGIIPLGSGRNRLNRGILMFWRTS